MKNFFNTKIAIALATTLISTSVLAGTVVINSNQADPAPKAALQAVIDGFEAENPDVDVVLNI